VPYRRVLDMLLGALLAKQQVVHPAGIRLGRPAALSTLRVAVSSPLPTILPHRVDGDLS